MTAGDVRGLLARFAQHCVLVVGDPILDEYVSGDCQRISPEAPIPVLRVRESRVVAGGAANTAVNVATLGGQAVLAGVVGRDEAGGRVSALVGAHGVATALVTDHRPTPRKVRALGGQQQLLRLDYEDDAPVETATAAAVLRLIEAAVTRCSVVVISDYAKGLVNAGFCRDVLRLASAAGVPVVVDPRPQHADAYVGCDYLTPNWKEALGLLGEAEVPATPEHVTRVGPALVRQFRANVLLTLGPRGIRFFGLDDRECFDEPAQAREVFDVSGAGDTVVAAFALAIAAGASPRDAVRLANLAAGIVVAKVGTAAASARELADLVDAGDHVIDESGLEAHIEGLRREGRRPLLVSVSGQPTLADLDRLRDARQRGHVVIAGITDWRSADGDAQLRLLLALRDVDFVCVNRGDAVIRSTAVGRVG